MTLYFPSDEHGLLSSTFWVDGDTSGKTELNPDGYTSFALRLTSEYTNMDVFPVEQDPGFRWLFQVQMVENTERYTEYRILSFETADMMNKFMSGYYSFQLLGSYLDIPSSSTASFIADQWDTLLTGELKAKSKTTNDMQRGQVENLQGGTYQPGVVRYKTDPNTAQSYVIYRD